LVVTASVHPQLSGTRTLSPADDTPALLSGAARRFRPASMF
jgi:hypothetical protein